MSLHLRATSFATRQDIAAYARCRDAGHSASYCTSTPGGGDNGKGAYGADTWRTDQAWCAVHPSIAKGLTKLHVTLFDAHGKQFGKPFTCKVGDKASDGIIDLNPGCLVLAGLDPDTELSAKAIVEFI